MRWLWTLVALLSLACGRPPTQEEVEDAKARTKAALDAAQQVRRALELLGILPTYDCGEPRRSFVGKAVDQVKAELGCVTATAAELDASTDAVTLAYAAEGCTVRDYSLTGSSLFRYNGGEDRFDLEADFTETKLDGEPLRARAGYGKCSDEQRYWGAAQGPLPEHEQVTFRVDGRVAAREGLPVIGGTTLLLDGEGEVTHPDGADRVTFTGLEYELKEYLPKEGELYVETSSGRRVRARFKSTLWRLGEAEVTVDDRDPVKVPIVR